MNIQALNNCGDNDLHYNMEVHIQDHPIEKKLPFNSRF
jgi:hypothetical protein